MINVNSEINKSEIRKWLRKMYDCRWIYDNDIIIIVCDGEEFNIVPSTLDEEETKMLNKIIQDATKETNKSL